MKENTGNTSGKLDGLVTDFPECVDAIFVVGIAQVVECWIRVRKVTKSIPGRSDGRTFFSGVNVLC